MDDARERAARLVELGYRKVSNRYRIIARVDRHDWVSVMASQLLRAPADFYVPGSDKVEGGWCDYYRRCLSKDCITMPPEDHDVFKLIPSSSGDACGYVGPVPVEEPKGELHLVVTGKSLSTYMTHGVFSSKEKAEEWAERADKWRGRDHPLCPHRVEAIKLDPPLFPDFSADGEN